MNALPGLNTVLARLGRRPGTAGRRTAVEEPAARHQIADAPLRSQVDLEGTVTMVTINPRGGNRWLEAVLDDGSGEVTLIWMGRRMVRGIEAGRRLHVSGLVCELGGRRTIYNPKYALLAA